MMHYWTCMDCMRQYIRIYYEHRPPCDYCGSEEVQYDGGEDGEEDEEDGPLDTAAGP